MLFEIFSATSAHFLESSHVCERPLCVSPRVFFRMGDRVSERLAERRASLAGSSDAKLSVSELVDSAMAKQAQEFAKQQEALMAVLVQKQEARLQALSATLAGHVSAEVKQASAGVPARSS